LKKLFSVVAALLIAMTVGACGNDDPAVESGDESSQSEAPAENKVSIIETNYAFQVSGPVKAGTVSLEVSNQGTEFHETAFAKIVDGKTIDDVKAALDAATRETENPLEGVAEEESAMDGLGNAQTPGSSLTLTRDGVEAGEYAIICFIPNAEGESHFKLGMLSTLTVEEGDVTGGPEAAHTYTATDDKVDGPTELPAGETTFAIVNESSANREIQALKIKEGKTVEDVDAFFKEADSGQGPPDFAAAPIDFLFFAFDSDADRKLTLDLTPGTWAIGVPDPENQFEGPPQEDPHLKIITVA
jgi:uncharacterized cupredoxin-like copper-binding protein